MTVESTYIGSQMFAFAVFQFFFVSSDNLIEFQSPDLSMGGVGMTHISHNSVFLKSVLSTEYWATCRLSY